MLETSGCLHHNSEKVNPGSILEVGTRAAGPKREKQLGKQSFLLIQIPTLLENVATWPKRKEMTKLNVGLLF